MPTPGNALNIQSAGIVSFDGTATFTESAVTQHGVLVGGASNAVSSTAVGSTGQVLQANTGADPTYSTATFPSTAGTSGNILTSNGTNWTSTAPATSGTVTSVSGTANQVAVATGTTTPVISLIGPYTPATYTAHGVLVGEGTSSIVALAAGSSGQMLQSGGSSADPAYSTTTYPSTNAINTLLYASSANVMSALATANGGVLDTTSSGVPQVDTTNFKVLSTGVQVKANNTNTTPPAGFIGEQVRSFITAGSAVSLSNATPANITSISLTAGNWNISALFMINGTLTGTLTAGSISTTSATLSNAVGDSQINTPTVSSAASDDGFSIPNFFASISSTTTYFMVMQANFSAGTAKGYGRISATRVG